MAGAFPYLADEQRLRVFALDRAAERTPEAVVDLAGHVQPPAVDAEFPHPISAHIAEVFLHLWVGGIQFRHHPLIGEAGVARNFLRRFGAMHREGQIIEPVPVRRFFLIPDHVLKGKEMPAAVIEDAVDDDPDAGGVQGADHGPECLVSAEAGVHVIVIQQIVLVVFPGGKDWVQINAVDAQRLQVIHIPGHAFQCSAQLPVYGVLLKAPRMRKPGDFALAGGKAVRENIVHNSVSDPLRHTGNVAAVVERELEILRAVPGKPVRKKIAVIKRCFLAVIQQEIVIDPVIGAVHDHLPVIVAGIRQELFHGDGGKKDGIDPARGIGIEERHLLQISPGAAQPVDDAALIQPAAVFRHGKVQNGIQLHPFTPPAVSPEVIYLWHRKKITSTGTETVMAAAAKTGQEPVISVA